MASREAVRRQSAYFEDAAVEHDWLEYNARFRAQSNLTSHVASPCGDPDDNAKSQDRFSISPRLRKQGASCPMAPGSPSYHWLRRLSPPLPSARVADLNLYKLFLEAAHALLKPAGRWVSSYLRPILRPRYRRVRRLFLDQCRWEWLFGIENRDRYFLLTVDSSSIPSSCRRAARRSDPHCVHAP